jgi:hypothetical protein
MSDENIVPADLYDRIHARKCRERWMERRHRKLELPVYQEEWYTQQCGICRYFVPLTSGFLVGWGVCTNENAPFDGRAMFQHDGCDLFDKRDGIGEAREADE